MIGPPPPLMWFDLMPDTPGRRVLEAPVGTDVGDVLAAARADSLPRGWRWVTAEEWEARRDDVVVCEIHLGEPPQ